MNTLKIIALVFSIMMYLSRKNNDLGEAIGIVGIIYTLNNF